MMRTFFIVFALFLSGCGFTPMHQVTGERGALTGVVVQLEKGKDVADNQAGFFLTQRLRDRVGAADEASPYTLKLVPSYRRARLGLTDGDVASRYDVTVSARWTLTEAKTGKVLDSGSTSTVSTFGAPSGAFGVITADNVGIEQAAQQTADKLIIEMAKALRAQASSQS